MAFKNNLMCKKTQEDVDGGFHLVGFSSARLSQDLNTCRYCSRATSKIGHSLGYKVNEVYNSANKKVIAPG